MRILLTGLLAAAALVVVTPPASAETCLYLDTGEEEPTEIVCLPTP